MATIRYKGVGITAMAACVPPQKAYNRDLTDIMPTEEVEKIINSVGIQERRICDEDIFASDLCYKAATKLIENNHIDTASIDMLLFMSQGADYRIPATSCILQNRLGLSRDCAAMDLSLGCSGYVYALSCAMAYTSMPGINRVLLLDGEAFSKIVNPKDKVNVPLYGDAGTATLIEKGDFDESVFILHSDGAGEDAVKVPAGMRKPLTPESLVVRERENGNYRSDIEVYMDGMEVFNFAIRIIPNEVKKIVREAGTEIDDADYIVFHQSNRFMTDFFTKKLKISEFKVPYCIGQFGNTSSASVPLTIVSELHDKLPGKKNLIMCGFGAGLSWGTAWVSFNDCHISPLIEY